MGAMGIRMAYAPGTVRQYLIVQLDRHACAFPVDDVLEIRAVPLLGRETGLGRAHVGSMEVRGERISVFDLRTIVGLTPGRGRPDSSILLVLGGGIRRGLLVDRVSEILELADEEIDAAERAPIRASVVVGVAQRPEPLIVLDRRSILDACARAD